MIIKAIPVKSSGGVSSTINYIARDKGRIPDYRNQGIFHNLSSTELNAIITEFSNNYEAYAKKRSNGNRALHTILSVNPLDREKISITIMDSIVQHYLEIAYPRALAFGTHHITESHWHTHLLISANELCSDKSTRLSKADLKSIHFEMLEYIRGKHPELTIGIEEKTYGLKLHNEQEYFAEKRNPDVKLIKEVLAEKVQQLFRASESSEHFFNNLKEAGYTAYTHENKPFGIHYGEENHKMRFSRLGIDEEQLSELDKQNNRLQELESIRLEQDQKLENEKVEHAEETIEK
ncbi:MAG: hypothetical protein POELPBGB_02962 [Bacteroidia bacterium]|nr:hypothetical protein [Bacteroidia bacterium]